MFGHNQSVNTAFALSGVLGGTLASTLTMSLSVMAPPAFAQVRFDDVGSSYWANQYVQSLTEADIISGFPDGTFRPDEEMTRAQFASVLSGGFPRTAVREPITFSDVPANHWATGAIASAYAQGFLSGYPDGTFGLDQPITRLEVLVSLTNGLGIAPSGETATLLRAFADSDNIPEWAADAIAAAAENKLIVNYPDAQQLNPQRNATRAEIAAIAHQALVNRGRASAIASPYVPTVAGQTAPSPETPAETPAVEQELPSELPIAEAGSDEFSELVASLGSNDTAERKAAADTLAAKGAKAVPDLAQALESDNAQTRAAAAYALNEMGAEAEAATPTLLEVLKDDDELVRALATSTLSQVGLDQSALINLLVAAVQNESGLVNDVAADALVNIGGDAVPALGRLLENSAANSLAKQTAATLIGDIGQLDNVGDAARQSVIPILAETLSDGDSRVRKSAASALGNFGALAEAAIPALSRALLNENADAEVSVNQTIANSLRKIGQQSVPGLTESLRSDNTLTRLYAADAIWTLTKDSSLILPTLVSALSSGDVETLELATLGLTYLGRQALPALPDVRRLLGSNNGRIVSIAQLSLLILNNKNEPAPDLGFLKDDAEALDSVPAVVEVVSQLWQ